MNREKEPTIQKIDFRIMCDSISFWTDFSWGAIRHFYLHTWYELLKKSLWTRSERQLGSSIAHPINFQFWIVGRFSSIMSHMKGLLVSLSSNLLPESLKNHFWHNFSQFLFSKCNFELQIFFLITNLTSIMVLTGIKMYCNLLIDTCNWDRCS